MRKWWEDFKAFALSGNLVEIAVAFVLAVAFGALVLSFLDNIIMPLIAAIFGEPTFDDLTASVGDGVITYGSFITAFVNFLLIAFVLFLIVKVYQRATKTGAPEVRPCPHCLTDIPVQATRCSACTSEVTPEAA